MNIARFMGLAFLGMVLSISIVMTPQAVQAQSTIRVGTFIPPQASWHRVFRAWNKSLKKKSGGSLSIKMVSFADEAKLVKAMKSKKVDVAIFSTLGLQSMAPAAAVLSAPGVAESVAAVEALQASMSADFDAAFANSDFILGGWIDFGGARLFSTVPITSVVDLRGKKMWVPSGDKMGAAFARATKAKAKKMKANQLLAALKKAEVEVFPGSALAATGMGWLAYAKYISPSDQGVVVGANLIRESSLSALSVEERKIFLKVTNKAMRALRKMIRKDEKSALATVNARGLKEFGGERAKWNAAAKKTSDSLVPSLFSRGLLDKARK